MNKKGFTLIELTVSIVLLSLIMVFMFNFLSILKKDEDKIENNTEIIVMRNSISQYINEDIRNNEGISEISCCNEYDCTYTCPDESENIDAYGIHMKNGKIKKITLVKAELDENTKPYQIVMYEDITDTNNIVIELKRQLPEKYSFNPLIYSNMNNLHYIKIPVTLHPELDIEIVYQNKD